MRKLFITTVFIASLAFSAPLFAQKFAPEHESEFFVVNVSVEKLYPYRKGYVVQYRKGVNQMANVYLPGEWFTNAASQGEMLWLLPGKSWPSLSVYYKNGEFSHVRLYAHRWRGHQTWGNIPLNVNIDDRFENVDTIKLEY
jgi:hypothetical protein